MPRGSLRALVVVRTNLTLRPDRDSFFHRCSRTEDERHEAEAEPA